MGRRRYRRHAGAGKEGRYRVEEKKTYKTTAHAGPAMEDWRKITQNFLRCKPGVKDDERQKGNEDETS